MSGPIGGRFHVECLPLSPGSSHRLATRDPGASACPPVPQCRASSTCHSGTPDHRLSPKSTSDVQMSHQCLRGLRLPGVSPGNTNEGRYPTASLACENCPDLYLSTGRSGLASTLMMRPQVPSTQVRGANFLDEILDGISNLQLVLYRTGCHGRRGALHLHARCKWDGLVIRIVRALDWLDETDEEVSSGAPWPHRP
jgi:hypothetical protein